MDPFTYDLVIRSRPTILEILENRGFNVDSYKDISPDEIMKMTTTNQSLLTINVKHKTVEDSRVIVLYYVEYPIRLRLEQELNAILDKENSPYNPEKDQFILILSEPFHDIFHLKSAKLWTSNKYRISFFNLKSIVTNPARHSFVPPHRKLSDEEVAELMKSLHLKSKYELPNIKYHIDMQARVLGLIPGDVVEIKRPSETAGEYIIYRVCTI